MKTRIDCMLLFLFIVAVGSGTSAYGQGGHEVPHSQAEDYGPEFFDQLQRMFERLTNADIHHVFQMSRPIPCSELTGDQNEWRDVAFFSGRRKIGNWYRASLDEVKADVAVYIFQGACPDARAALQLTTKVPVEEGDRPAAVKINPPVKAYFNTEKKAYTFDLPYLFRGKSENGASVYTFRPRHESDRYVTHITSHWECKAMAEEYATYKFLICHTLLFGHDPVDITHGRDKPTYSFGASAYTILSDGKVASAASY
jgi:hypothetical protein